ncbi:MAG: molybdenum cofactor biosynthesis protein MoeC [Dehalococcoidia bacterium]|nr:MAG: molybdenum cofactor biosynthesis protein MoeC [Dehalococcoidia bacterium]
MTVKPGWQGRFFEDFEVGDVYRHNLGRTLTDADNIWFTLLTMNTNPIHFDAEYARGTSFGRMLINSCLTLAIVTGQSVPDVSENAVNLGWDEVRLPNPLYAGDTLYAESEVIEKRESRSRPEAGIVTIRTRGLKQDGTVVIEFKRTMLVYKRDHAPKRSLHPAARHDL